MAQRITNAERLSFCIFIVFNNRVEKKFEKTKTVSSNPSTDDILVSCFIVYAWQQLNSS